MTGFQAFLFVCGCVFVLGLLGCLLFARKSDTIIELALSALLMQSAVIVAAIGSVVYAIAMSGVSMPDANAPVCTAKVMRGDDQWTCTKWEIPEVQP